MGDREQIANFNADMTELLAEIEELSQDGSIAYGVAYPRVRYFERGSHRYFEGPEHDPAIVDPHPDEFSYTMFRIDIRRVCQNLGFFQDSANPTRLGEINDRMLELEALLEAAAGYDGGMNEVSNALQGWAGGAAANFRNVVLAPFHRVVSGQAKLAKEIAIAALSYQALIEHSRAASLDLATQLKKKLTNPYGSGGLDLGILLWVAGAAAAGVATGGAAWAAKLAWVAVTVSEAYDQLESRAKFEGIQERAGDPPSGDAERTIPGGWAAEFIPATFEEVSDILSELGAEERVIRDGLQADADELDSLGFNEIEPAEPDLTQADRYEDLGVRQGEVAVENIVALKRAGVADLPAIAQILHLARGKVLSARTLFNLGLGDSTVVGIYRSYFDQTLDTLLTALTRTRDFLYQSGQSLSAIADDYYEADDSARQELEAFLVDEGYPEGTTFADLVEEELADFNEPVYVPPPPPRHPGMPL